MVSNGIAEWTRTSRVWYIGQEIDSTEQSADVICGICNLISRTRVFPETKVSARGIRTLEGLASHISVNGYVQVVFRIGGVELDVDKERYELELLGIGEHQTVRKWHKGSKRRRSEECRAKQQCLGPGGHSGGRCGGRCWDCHGFEGEDRTARFSVIVGAGV